MSMRDVRLAIHYHTQWGEHVAVCGTSSQLGDWDAHQAVPLYHLGNGEWVFDGRISGLEVIEYKYLIRRDDDPNFVKWEQGANRVLNVGPGSADVLDVRDAWRQYSPNDNVFFSSAFTHALLRRDATTAATTTTTTTTTSPNTTASATALPPVSVAFRARVALVPKNFSLCVVGDIDELGAWKEEGLVVLDDSTQYPLWRATVAVDVTDKAPLNFAGNPQSQWRRIEYKYGLYNNDERKLVAWEEGSNRVAFVPPPLRSPMFGSSSTQAPTVQVVQTDEVPRFPYPHNTWRGVGVALPVFSLRTTQSAGVGDFGDIRLFIDWAVRVGISVVQVLPINDTTATFTWEDSYPYSAISVFALHPQYLNLSQMGKLADVADQQKYLSEVTELQALDQVDYERVMKLKWWYSKRLFDSLGAAAVLKKDAAFAAYVSDNAHWLYDYTAFCCLRDRFQSADWLQWPQAQRDYDGDIVKAMNTNVNDADYEKCIYYSFIQYHLHLQLYAATTYARHHGVVFKGDLPIGIDRSSVDAWAKPKLYNMDFQAGAPPDAFAVAGQNWGFPTYNWEVMAEDNYSWWRQRLSTMAKYFDAYRIDHILGFFRIWQIPMHAVQGLLGHFYPCLPYSVTELRDVFKLHFDEWRWCQPYITDAAINYYTSNVSQGNGDMFNTIANCVRTKLTIRRDHTYHLRDFVRTQRAVEQYEKYGELLGTNDAVAIGNVKTVLSWLISEVLFVRIGDDQYCPRISMVDTLSYKSLDPHSQHMMKIAYDYFYFRRHNDFWRQQAMQKLPAVCNATNMLVCGEDLGMVPDCVPGVMDELGILSLEIQRMPKSTKIEFGHPADAPYRSVVSPSSHDMSTVRGWWEEDGARAQRFFTHILGHPMHEKPPFYAEPWLCKEVYVQHVYSPSMLAIFPLQDILALNGELRRQDPTEEQINVPANPKHYWRYRMHVNVESLLTNESGGGTDSVAAAAAAWNAELRELHVKCGRMPPPS